MSPKSPFLLFFFSFQNFEDAEFRQMEEEAKKEAEKEELAKELR